jgi:Tol biopolymer transport system component
LAASGLIALISPLTASSSARKPFRVAGGLIVFEQLRDNGPAGPTNDAAFVVRSDGHGLRRQSPSCPDCGDSPRWSPDGTKLAYLQPLGIAVVNADGSDPRTLSCTSCWADLAWSPDGHRIATGWSGGPTDNCTLMILDTRGKPVNCALHTTLFLDGAGLDWSPDGKQLAFVASPSTHSRRPPGLYVVNNDGSGLRLISRDGEYARWSPDGKGLLYTAGDGRKVYAQRISSGPPSLIRAFSSPGRAFAVAWSPDGQQIAYSGLHELHVLDLATGSDRQIRLPLGVCGHPNGCFVYDWKR